MAAGRVPVPITSLVAAGGNEPLLGAEEGSSKRRQGVSSHFVKGIVSAVVAGLTGGWHSLLPMPVILLRVMTSTALSGRLFPLAWLA